MKENCKPRRVASRNMLIVAFTVIISERILESFPPIGNPFAWVKMRPLAGKVSAVAGECAKQLHEQLQNC